MSGVRGRYASGTNRVTVTRTWRRSVASRESSLRNYWLLLCAFFTSIAGDWLYKIALPLLVLRLTGSALQTAAVYSLEYVPYLLFALLGGVVTDRANRRTLLVYAQSAAAVVTGLLAILVWYGDIRLAEVYAAAFALSSITPLYQASFQALLPSTVCPDRLSWANSRLQAAQGTLDLAGPLLGAGVVAALGVAWSLSLDSASFALSALAIALISKAIGQSASGRTSVRADIRAAIAFVRSASELLWGAILGAGTTFGLMLIEANMITYLVHYRHQPVALVGIVFASLGGGALIGALFTPRILRRAAPGLVIIACMVGGGVATALLLVSRNGAEIAVSWVLVGAFTMIFTVTFYTLRHQLVPVEMLGRVVVITRVIGWGALPLAPLVGGALLGFVGAFWPVILLSAVLQVGVGIIGLFTPLRTANPKSRPQGEVPGLPA